MKRKNRDDEDEVKRWSVTRHARFYTNMDEVNIAVQQLTALLPHYMLADEGNERAAYFRGLMAKAVDSLVAIDFLVNSNRPVWPLHCRWLVEALGYASALNADEKMIDQIKRHGAKTYCLVVDVPDVAREQILVATSPTSLPNIQTLLQNFETNAGVEETGALYKVYRLLCEYTHFEFYRTIAYPALGVEAASVLDERKSLFLKMGIAAALSLPSFAHCPPSCGFDDEHCEKISRLREEAWGKVK